MRPITVLIADDHAVVRAGVRFTIADEPDLEFVGEAHDGKTALALVSRIKPDVLLLDVNMPGFGTAVGSVRTFHQQHPRMAILIYTAYNNPSLARDLLEAGARGYFTKDESNQALVQAIKQVADGGIYLTQQITNGMFATPLAPQASYAADPPLTPREEEILDRLGDGLTPEEIASRLGIAVSTVRTHMKSIYAKYGFTSMAQAALYAARRKGIDGGSEPPSTQF